MYRTNFTTSVNSCSDDEDALDLIETNMNNLNGYVSAVYTMEAQIQTPHFRLKGEDYREAVTNLGKRCRNTHETTITACPILNRLANLAGAEPFYSGNLEDRNEVVEFCIAIVDEFFHGHPRCAARELLEELKQVGGGIITYIEKENRFGVLKTHSGHNATLIIQTFEGMNEVSCRLTHEDAINSSYAMFNTFGGKLQLSLDFHNLYILPGEWEKAKVVVDDMLAL